MAIARQRRNMSYGVGQPLYDIPPESISSTRAPTTSDMAQLGTIWTNKSTNAAWVLASIVSSSATWTPTTVNAGATITTGDLTVTAGDVVVSAGDIDVTLGDVDVADGDINVALGAIEVTAGNITATAGEIHCGDDIYCTTDVNCRSVFITGDEGTGFANQVTLTNVVDETLGAGAGTALMKTGNPGNSSGWLKIYNGTSVRYVPYWTDISP